mmetsp:Transcript_5990/g.14283  ORF Transcript_5990/g.14283 Transcript_5990/m.14283 type:complete len:676 (-) Transcript_5990:16-2043(-)
MKLGGVLVFGVPAVAAEQGSAVAKVIQLLQNMSDKGKAEMQEEQVKFAKFSEFCKNTAASKEASIAKSKEDIEDLQAEIGQLTAQIGELGREITQLAQDATKWNSEVEQAESDRAKEHQEYLDQLKDYSESLDALDRAVAELKKHSGKIGQASYLLLQLTSRKELPLAARRVIQTFLDEDPETAREIGMLQGPPEANAYESHGASIIELLEKLKDKFRSQKGDLEKEEMNAQHSHDMVVQDLKAQIKHADRQRSDKEQRSQAKSERKSAAEGELSDTQAVLAEDEDYYAELTSECEQKHSDFSERQALRKGELEAIEQAVAILSSPEMAVDGTTARDQKYGFVATSFLQLRSNVKNPDQARVAAFLSTEGARLGSQALAQLAGRVQDDVFSNVKKMIRDMMRKLQQQAEEEAEHKGWCDTELGTNKQTRDTKTESLDQVSSEIEELGATISKLDSEVGDLTAAVSDLRAAMEKATADREAEKEKNETTIAEAKEAQRAVSKATSVLKDFYAKAGKATALTQITIADIGAPETFSEPYTGMQGANGGVVGLLEVILSDFVKLERETTMAEAQAEKEFQKFMVEAKRDSAVKSRDSEHRTRQRQEAESSLVRRQQEKATTTEELEAAERYYEKLRPSCIDEGVSYEERVSKRENEIKSLKEALTLLEEGVEFSGRSK